MNRIQEIKEKFEVNNKEAIALFKQLKDYNLDLEESNGKLYTKENCFGCKIKRRIFRKNELVQKTKHCIIYFEDTNFWQVILVRKIAYHGIAFPFGVDYEMEFVKITSAKTRRQAIVKAKLIDKIYDFGTQDA